MPNMGGLLQKSGLDPAGIAGIMFLLSTRFRCDFSATPMDAVLHVTDMFFFLTVGRAGCHGHSPEIDTLQNGHKQLGLTGFIGFSGASGSSGCIRKGWNSIPQVTMASLSGRLGSKN